jgi:3-phenylpropionate/trans-cinnamate dioxygenase ferredoxin reductase subunit
VLIVGAGAAGIGGAIALRAGKFGGSIVMLGEEECAPYDRPPLSKQVLAGTWEPEKANLLSQMRLDALDLEWRLGRRASSLDLAAQRVTVEDDEEIPFDQLVVATGMRPRQLPGTDMPGVHVLRTLEDALALKAAIVPAVELVVIGAGFLGLEVAATARQLGATVTVVEPVDEPLADRIGAEAASRLLALHRLHGVTILTGVSVTEIHNSTGGDERVTGVELRDGTLLPAQLVLVAIGCIPNTDFLEGSGLVINDGVVCDEYCAAAPGVWAAGDVARWFHPVVGRHVRLEHRMNATEQANAVARNVLGHAEVFAPVPFFWTDHFDAKIQVAGFVPPGEAGEVVESSGNGSFIQVFRVANRLVGVLGWNSVKAMLPYRRELAEASG